MIDSGWVKGIVSQITYQNQSAFRTRWYMDLTAATPVVAQDSLTNVSVVQVFHVFPSCCSFFVAM